MSHCMHMSCVMCLSLLKSVSCITLKISRKKANNKAGETAQRAGVLEFYPQILCRKEPSMETHGCDPSEKGRQQTLGLCWLAADSISNNKQTNRWIDRYMDKQKKGGKDVLLRLNTEAVLWSSFRHAGIHKHTHAHRNTYTHILSTHKKNSIFLLISSIQLEILSPVGSDAVEKSMAQLIPSPPDCQSQALVCMCHEFFTHFSWV